MMRTYAAKRIFSNEHDGLAGLEHALRERFRESSVEVVGCAALFAARA